MARSLRSLLLAAVVLSAPACASGQPAPAAVQPAAPAAVSYTTSQAEAGAQAYASSACAACHMPDLSGAEGPPLVGPSFTGNWGNGPVSALFQFTKENMPATAPGSLSDQTYVEIVAYLLSRNGLPAGETPLSADESRAFGAAAR
jgi:mono/diheme cytochrome c family protein